MSELGNIAAARDDALRQGGQRESESAARDAGAVVRSMLAWTVHRWPAWLALAIGAAMWGAAPESLAELLLLLPLLYLIMAVVRRRSATWPVLAILVAGFVAAPLQDVVEPSTVVLAVALLVLVVGVARWQKLPNRGMFLLQVAGMVAFAATGLVGLVLAPEVGRYMVAAGWFAHGLWDLAHLRMNKVVSRSYAEWCGTLDVLVAAGLIFLP